MARTAAPERPNPFLSRCNLEPSTRLNEMVEPAVSRPELAFKIAMDELLDLISHTVIRIRGRDGAEAALRELWAALLEVKAKVARDPGIRMAADDLYEAAAALVAARSVGPDGVDVRRWRLLKEAGLRLRTRLASAQPSDKAQLLGLN
jgi:hypothetical protein